MDLRTVGPATHKLARFGQCDVDILSREVVRDGTRTRFQNHSFQILMMLLEKPGQVVTRDELRQKLWRTQEFVDFDQGLNTSVMRLRHALDDTAQTPRFIETLPRLGYRFIAPVTFSDATTESMEENLKASLESREDGLSGTWDDSQNSEAVQQDAPSRRRVYLFGALGCIALPLLLIGLASGRLQTLLGSQARAKVLPTMAVLPFDGLSNDPAQNFLAEGMTEQLITELGKLQDLRIVSRGSVMQYDGKHVSLEDAAKQLNADYLFEGSVTESGGRIRVTANLYEAATRRHIWAETYYRAAGDGLSPQREIVLDMTRSIQSHIALR